MTLCPAKYVLHVLPDQKLAVKFYQLVNMEKLKICKKQTLMILIEPLKGVGPEMLRSCLSSVLSPGDRDGFGMRFLEAGSRALNHAVTVLSTVPLRLLEGGS